ncbi:FHA domain-containing protein [Mycetocola tolaasinivorans]|uniref:FHA domain-containing protein n=1 Tax=Mycetocola tolaasinivorans TaxID=76635 RepID=A0A3L7ADT0_9MICO|nr:FHA domain-containing protein [Mycetocola tolaasinivorans]
MRRPASGDAGEPAVDATAAYSQDLGTVVAPIDREISEAEQAAIGALPPGSALLIVRRGPNTGARFLLDSDVSTVGRHPNASIFLDDVTVSRKHAEFRRTAAGGFELHDLKSLNGTYHAGERVESVELYDGAEVQVGKFRLTFYPSRHDVRLPGDA